MLLDIIYSPLFRSEGVASSSLEKKVKAAGCAKAAAISLLACLLISCADQSATNSSDESAIEPTSANAPQCESGSGFDVYCGFHNPEDLVIVPGGDALLVSEMGEFMVHEPSGLALLNLQSGMREPIEISWIHEGTNEQRWGDATCAVPDAELFSPHGIDLIQRQDERYQVLAVNHGGRESVEFFELSAKGSDSWQLTWRGCALPPGDPFINDVAGLQDGGFLVTHMWNKSQPFEAVVAQLLGGEKTGWVYEWQADEGFTQLPASLEHMPNGIAVNADNTKIFVNIYMGNKTIRIDRETGQKDGEFVVQQPDNITVDEQGTLWVASHKHDPINQTCTEPGVCLLPFEIVSADPDTLETKVAVAHEGAPMGYSTVGLKVGDRVFMGSAHGDRVASYPLNP